MVDFYGKCIGKYTIHGSYRYEPGKETSYFLHCILLVVSIILVKLKVPTDKWTPCWSFLLHGHQQQIRIDWYTGSLGEILTQLQQDGGQNCGVKQLTILSFAHPRVEVANVNDYLPRLLHSCKLSARPYR